ncbi:MAG TPA: alpha/beta hydrolase [Acidimicrobiales bacterium]|jgi:acetyl esterase|nr:alpha/beta hydrolase [Acidimicrobiales bacterium]
MPLDPRLRPILALANRMGEDDATFPAKRLASTIQARQLGRLVMQHGPKVPARELMVPVHGGAIRVRLYEPATARPRPLHVFLHGGGWCVGDLDQRDPRCRSIAAGAGCTVASVDYRMAPENAYPVPLEDGYAALAWLVDHADDLGLDATRVSVGGESAGANLAALVALLARDRNGPPLVFQWLDVPATDLTLSQPSIDRLGTGYGLTKVDMEAFRAAYLRDVDPKDPYVSPLHYEDLRELPPALIATMEYDPLQDDGAAYVRRLREAGVEVEHHHLPGMVHASFAFTRLLPLAREYQDAAVAALRRAYA